MLHVFRHERGFRRRSVVIRGSDTTTSVRGSTALGLRLENRSTFSEARTQGARGVHRQS